MEGLGDGKCIERKRTRSASPTSPPWRRPQKGSRKNGPSQQRLPSGSGTAEEGSADRRKQENFAREQTRLNQIQEAEQMRQWVSQEDNFVLKQAKKKAEIRVKEGRAKPIDWLAVTLRVIDPTRDPLDEEIADSELDFVDPYGVFEGLNDSQLLELEHDIDIYIALETNRSNREFWTTMNIICKDRRQQSKVAAPEGRAVSSVSNDIDRLLGPKSYEELEVLEQQIARKMRSNEPIDVDYWEQLLRSLTVWKAKAKLKKVYQSVIENRMGLLRAQQQEEAAVVQKKLESILAGSKTVMEGNDQGYFKLPTEIRRTGRVVPVPYLRELDPEPLLKLRAEEKALELVDESTLLQKMAAERRRVLKLGFVPMRQRHMERPSTVLAVKPTETAGPGSSRFAAIPNEDFSQATKALYDREVARGVDENEEIFAGEEEVLTTTKPQWASKFRPRKPRYFNRVQMGYEWNKYNQTHYDHDNPPPKVVQGYKFNIFYPDLIEKVNAPTYRIERENGRKRGQSFAPAGEEDTCLIRFIAGPPYEDLAFRIVDKEWDYSAKRERGFRSSFDKVLLQNTPETRASNISTLTCFYVENCGFHGILQLHFQFKKIYYRK